MEGGGGSMAVFRRLSAAWSISRYVYEIWSMPASPVTICITCFVARTRSSLLFSGEKALNFSVTVRGFIGWKLRGPCTASGNEDPLVPSAFVIAFWIRAKLYIGEWWYSSTHCQSPFFYPIGTRGMACKKIEAGRCLAKVKNVWSYRSLPCTEFGPDLRIWQHVHLVHFYTGIYSIHFINVFGLGFLTTHQNSQISN